MSYIYIPMNGARCELSHTVSRFCGRREQRRVRASLLSPVSRAACASFSQKNSKNVRQLENVPRRVYMPILSKRPQLHTIRYTISRRVASRARRRDTRTKTKTKIATVGKHAIVVTVSPCCRSQCQCGVIRLIITKYRRQQTQGTAPKRW